MRAREPEHVQSEPVRVDLVIAALVFLLADVAAETWLLSIGPDRGTWFCVAFALAAAIAAVAGGSALRLVRAITR